MDKFALIKQNSDTQIFLNKIFEAGKIYTISLGISGKVEDVIEEDLPRFVFEKYCSESINTEDEGYERLWFKSCVSGIRLIIDPTDISTAKSVEIYCLEMGTDDEIIYADKLEWVRVINIPFDTCFFKIGHPYLIRCGFYTSEYFIGMLKSMTPSEMKFISFKWDDVEHKYVEKEYIHTADEYKRHKKKIWYKPILLIDNWKDEPLQMPIVNVRKYIKNRREEVDEAGIDILDEIDGVIVSEFNSAFGGICDKALMLEDDEGDN